MGSRRLEPLDRHTWAANVATLACTRLSLQKASFPRVSIDFDELGVARGGLLEEVIRLAPCPLPMSYVSEFRQALRDISTSPDVARLLGTPSTSVSRTAINSILYTAIDNAVAQWGGGQKSGRAARARHIFNISGLKLQTGETISETGFVSVHPWEQRSASSLISEIYDEAFDDEELAAPISALPHENPDELNDKALSHLTTRLNRLRGACRRALDEFAKVKAAITEAQTSPPPPNMSSRMAASFKRGVGPDRKHFSGLNPEAKFWLAANLVKRDSFHRNYCTRRLSYEGMTGLERVTPGTKKHLFAGMLSTHYLPRYTLTACLLVLMSVTPWNASTVLSITSENVKRNRDGSYTVSGIKDRTDEVQEADLPALQEEDDSDDTPVPDSIDIADDDACKALELLLWHDANVEANAHRTSDSLFTALDLAHPSIFTFDIFDVHKVFDDFCKAYALKPFPLKSVREQVVSIEYLSTNKDVFLASALLRHKSIQTTHRYLNSVIIRLLNSANMKRFMDQLGASVIFACGGMKRVRDLNFDPAHVKEHLLFPPSKASKESDDSIADQWLNSIGDMRICITEAEIEHCALQHAFYKKSFQSLIRANEDRFRNFHFPRIVFCAALYQIIQQSAYRQMMTRFEETYNAA